MQTALPLENTLILGKIEGRRKGVTDDEMVGWHHRPDGHEFDQATGVGNGLGRLACCSPWGCKEADTTEHLSTDTTSVQFNSVTQSCPTLFNPMDCSTPGLPVLHQLPEFTQTHAH